ncbi:MAG: NAD(P)-dependent oxidoreductase [Marinobacter sp.]|uniref:NAD-dependent epimerase/dehydratase family protein n=1 Tax=Marinobacter sp. TaxID=50741 RepID=UPI0034A02C3A
MKLLITGAGLIGVNTAQQALAAGHTVVLLDAAPNRTYLHQMLGKHVDKLSVVRADVCDSNGLLKIVQDQGVDTIVHTAGLIGKRLDEDPFNGINTNVMGSMNLLEAARQVSVRRFVFLSSFGVYARDLINSEEITENAPIGRTRIYATTKVCTEQLIRAFAERYDLNTVILRPAAVYGFGHYSGGSGIGTAMAGLMQKIMAGGPVHLPNRSFRSNEYLYCKDAASAVLAACKPENPAGGTYNVGTGIVHSAQELGDILTAWQPSLDISLEPCDPIPPIAALNVRAAAQDLGFRATYSLQDGLTDYRDNLLTIGPHPAAPVSGT